MDFLLSAFHMCGRIPKSLVSVLAAIVILFILTYFMEKHYENNSN